MPASLPTLDLETEPALPAETCPLGLGARLAGLAAATWGVGAHLAIIAVAIRRLLAAGLAGLAGAGTIGWALAAACVAAFLWFQGYRGFQRAFSPLVAGRAAHLASHPRPWHALAAPLHVCGFVHATPGRRTRAALLFGSMPFLVWGVARLPEPWHAAVDLGVACGLLWGAACLVLHTGQALAGRAPAVPLDLPAGEAP